jgi:hypothetical protein
MWKAGNVDEAFSEANKARSFDERVDGKRSF